MDGSFRTPIFMEERGYQRKSTTYRPLVSKPFHPWKRPDNRTNKRNGRRLSPACCNLYGTCHQSATIYAKGRGPQRVPTIRKTIQRRRIKALPTKTSLGSRYRIQKGRAGSSRLQSVPHELNRGRGSTKIHQQRTGEGVYS